VVHLLAYICPINEQQHAMNHSKRTQYSNEALVEMLKAEIEKSGNGFYSQRRRTIEEMLRMRGIVPAVK
jgi:hypothetical protein